MSEKTTYKGYANSRRWHFLLVGEHGQIKSVKKFRGLAILAITLIAVAVIGIAGLGFLYLRAQTHNMRLNDRIADLKQQISAIQTEKEILMARLVIAETKLGQDPAAAKPVPAKPDPASELSEEMPPEPVAPPPKSQATSPPSESQIADAAKADPPPSADEAEMVIAVEDFAATLDTYQNILTVQYKVRNAKSDGNKVSGHTVLILKNSEQDISTWVVLPDVELVDGRPTGEKGQPFRIARFRTAKFTVEGYSTPSQFDTAIVYVYTKTGELVLEKEFPVQIKVI